MDEHFADNKEESLKRQNVNRLNPRRLPMCSKCDRGCRCDASNWPMTAEGADQFLTAIVGGQIPCAVEKMLYDVSDQGWDLERWQTTPQHVRLAAVARQMSAIEYRLKSGLGVGLRRNILLQARSLETFLSGVADFSCEPGYRALELEECRRHSRSIKLLLRVSNTC